MVFMSLVAWDQLGISRVSGEQRALLEALADFGNELARQRQLVGARQHGVAVFVEQNDGILILPEGVVADIPDQQGNALAFALGGAVFDQVFRLGGKADAIRPARQRSGRGDRGEDVGVLHELEFGRAAAVLLFQLLLARVGDAPVGHGRHRDEHMLAFDARHHGVVHLLGREHVDAAHAVRRGERGRPRYQRHLGAGFAGGARDRITHLAGRKIGDAAHRIDRLESRPGRDQHALAGQDFMLEGGDQFFEQLLGFEHASKTRFAAGLFARAGAEDADAVCAQGRHVALGGRVLPHFDVHRRGDQKRHAARTRHAQGREQVVAGAVRQFADEVGRAGRDQHRVGAAREVDVRHVVRHARIPLIEPDGVAGQRLHRHGTDEMGRRIGHHDLHLRALLDQRAAQFGRLVAGHAPGQAENDLFTLQVHAHLTLLSACSRGAVRRR